MGLNQGIEIVVNIPVQYKDLVILSDEEKINHALSNLLSNALKYTSKGTVELGFDLRDGVVEFYVKDTGYGIPEKEQRHIFESFFG